MKGGFPWIVERGKGLVLDLQGEFRGQISKQNCDSERHMFVEILSMEGAEKSKGK